jgi:UDP-2,3-diacylglucosamine pyrophosphatase LpxH
MSHSTTRIAPSDRQGGDLMSTIVQTTSAKPDARERGLQTVSGKDAPACEQSQTASALDDYDERILLMHRAFNEIAKVCYWTDYTLDAADWALLDAARLDELPYDELRAALVHAYRQIKRKAQAAQVTNHSRLRR